MLETSFESHGSVELFSPAKLNLSLLIYGKRPDGFHDLHSVMASLNFADKLVFSYSRSPGIYLEITGADSSVPSGPENLIWRAAQLLADHAGLTPAVHVKVDKKIPAGGGMGGASSNAATTLLGLNRLWKLNWPVDKLAGLAARLGSDVSFFLYTPLAQCTGRGELVSPLSGILTKKVMLILPGMHVSTAEVYRNYSFDSESVDSARVKVDDLLSRSDFDGLFDLGLNSLTAVTMKLVPELNYLRETIGRITGKPVHMSGSGSTLYICGDSTDELRNMSDDIQGAIGPRCRFVITDFANK